MEKKTDATTSMPHAASVSGGATDSHTAPDEAAAHRAMFVSMALGMSWQLAVVVLVPIVGGYMLDGRLHSTPWLTFTGLAIAAAAVFAVLWRVVKEAERRTTANNTKPKGTA